MELNKIYKGDCLEVMKTFPDNSIDMCMTSPPYWALRDYGVDGQLGLESTFKEYINKLCDIFDEVKRVLKKEGTCWVNMGDSYAGNMGKKSGWTDNKLGFSKDEAITKGVCLTKKTKIIHQLPQKCLVQIPSRFAIEMTNRGWILRNEIIWYKPNCMPSSVKDRFTVDFEKIFFFSKNKKYYFETQFEPVKQCSIERLKRAVSNQNKWVNGPDGQTKHTMNQPRPNRNTKIPAETCENYGSPRARYKRYEKSNAPHEFEGSDHLVSPFDPNKGRNKRTVWKITTKPFKEVHFAVYPEELCETPIKAGCPKKGIVLDPFFGAGTTAVVAKKLNRNYIGIELNPEYIKIANDRLEKIQDSLF